MRGAHAEQRASPRHPSEPGAGPCLVCARGDFWRREGVFQWDLVAIRDMLRSTSANPDLRGELRRSRRRGSARCTRRRGCTSFSGRDRREERRVGVRGMGPVPVLSARRRGTHHATVCGCVFHLKRCSRSGQDRQDYDACPLPGADARAAFRLSCGGVVRARPERMDTWVFNASAWSSST
jgi:hypothetical protein